MRVVGTRIPTTGEDRKIYSTADSTASTNQTVFAVNYDEGKVACWLNGIRLVQGQDFSYTASGIGSQITLSSGIAANDYVEVVGYQGIYSGNALVEDRFVIGTSSTGSGGSYTNSTTVLPVANNAGDLVCVYRNGIKLVHTTDFVVSASGNTVTLQNAANTADEITVHVIGILQHSNFVQSTGGTFTGTVAHTGTLNVSGGTLTTSTAQKTAIVDGGKGNLTKSDVGLSNVTNDAQVPASGGTFSGNVSFGDNNITNVGDIAVDTISSDSGTSIGVTLGTDAGDDFNVGSGKLVVEGDTGKVGIGTNAPAEGNKTHIKYSDNTTHSTTFYRTGLEVENTSSTTNSFAQLHLRCGSADWMFRNLQQGANDGNLHLTTDNGTSLKDVTVLDNNGNVTVVDGNLVIGTSGHGIQFQSAGGLGTSGEANTLDEYESGAWQPVVGGTWSTTPTVGSYAGRYIKIGRLVVVDFVFSNGQKTTAINGYFTGLPFGGAARGAGTCTDSGVINRGQVLLANGTRIWLTGTIFGATNYITASYYTAN